MNRNSPLDTLGAESQVYWCVKVTGSRVDRGTVLGYRANKGTAFGDREGRGAVFW